MKELEKIGFYTLCDKRAIEASTTSPLWRNELIINLKTKFHPKFVSKNLSEDWNISLTIIIV